MYVLVAQGPLYMRYYKFAVISTLKYDTQVWDETPYVLRKSKMQQDMIMPTTAYR